MSSQHKRPFMAFVVLVVLAAALIGNGIRANAEHGRFIAAGVISATTPLTHGTLSAPAGEGSSVLPAAAALVAAATPPTGRERSTRHRTASGTAHERDKNAPDATAATAALSTAPTTARGGARTSRIRAVTHALADHGRERTHHATGRVRAVVEHALDAAAAAPGPGRGHGYGRAHAPGQLAGHGHADHGRHVGHGKHAAQRLERLRGR